MKRIIENIGIIFWMAMDAFWMNDLITLSKVSAIIALILLALCKPKQKEDLPSYFATLSWLGMNTAWMMHDSTGQSVFYIGQNIFLIFAILSLILIFRSDIGRIKNIRRFKK